MESLGLSSFCIQAFSAAALQLTENDAALPERKRLLREPSGKMTIRHAYHEIEYPPENSAYNAGLSIQQISEREKAHESTYVHRRMRAQRDVSPFGNTRDTLPVLCHPFRNIRRVPQALENEAEPLVI